MIDRVKFGAPLSEVCTSYNDIPGPLLILILKLNKEAPYKKDVFRAPGHHSNMKKLIYCLQNGRLVNIDHYTVYTIASVLKKFLRKLPGGIFSMENEAQLFKLIKSTELDLNEKQEHISRLINNLPLVNQHLLVLLFGTFNAISTSAQTLSTGMSSEAIGVSVAPSFFHSCVPLGYKVARMEDVQTFKLATLATQFLIDNFGVNNLFGIENYNYYGRISGRILRRRDNWIFADKYPANANNMLPIDSRLTSNLTGSLTGENLTTTSSSTSGALRNSELMNKNTTTAKEQQPSVSKQKSTSKGHRDCLDSEKQPYSLHSINPQFHHSASSSFTHHSLNNQPTTHSPHGLTQEHYNSLTDDIYGRLSMSLEDNVFKTNSSLIGGHPGHYSSNNSPCNVSTTSTTPSNVCSPLGDLSENLSGIYDQRQISLPLHYSTQCSPISKDHHHQQMKSKTDKANEAMIEEEIKNLDQLKALNLFAESTKSLTYLPMVHERQTQRMNARSEWFLNPNEQSIAKSDDDLCTSSMYGNQYSGQKSGAGTSSSSYYYSSKDPSSVNGTRSIIRKTSSKDKRIVRRSSSKKDKENGNQMASTQSSSQQQASTPRTFGILSTDTTSLSRDDKPGSSYKPRL